MAQVQTVTPDGDAIRAARRAQNLSAPKLCALLGGRHPQYLWRIERGLHDRVSRVFMNQLAMVLDTPVDDLIKDAA